MSEIKITVQNKRRPALFCPLSAQLGTSAKQAASLTLVDQWHGAPVPFQAEEAEGGCRIHWLCNSLAAGQQTQYVLKQSKGAEKAPGVELKEEGEARIAVKVGGNLLTAYRYGSGEARPSLYPLIGPFGQGVTRAFPFEEVEGDDMDHKHHRSVYCAWGDVNGADVWSEQEGHGCVRHREFESWGSGPAFGWIGSRNDWVDAGGKKLMEDRVTLRFYNLPAGMRMIDFEVTLMASEGDVRFGDTKEGGICSVRVATSMIERQGGRIENACGAVGEGEAWGKRAPWCDYSGPVAGHTVGVAVFDHPRNFRYPTYWHVRDYGLMTANPFGLSHFRAPDKADGAHTLPAGERLEFRYRVYVHAGDAREGDVAAKYLNWVYPPEVTVEV